MTEYSCVSQTVGANSENKENYWRNCMGGVLLGKMGKTK